MVKEHSVEKDSVHLTDIGEDKMINYKIVKYCRGCKVRFTVEKGESRKNYCNSCQKKIDKERNQEE